jgi:hypothetical protein
VITSHYAEPVERRIAASTELRAEPNPAAAVVALLDPGTSFAMLDSRLGWAWGYAGEDGRVGYVISNLVTAA